MESNITFNSFDMLNTDMSGCTYIVVYLFGPNNWGDRRDISWARPYHRASQRSARRDVSWAMPYHRASQRVGTLKINLAVGN